MTVLLRHAVAQSRHRCFSPATGSNAYIIDSGVWPHRDFAGRYRFAFDAFGGDGRDYVGRGTGVAGVVGSDNHGVAKQVTLHNVKVIGCDSTAAESDVIAGVDWVTANFRPPAVATLTVAGALRDSHPAYGPLDIAIRDSIAAGVTYALAAGNDETFACFRSPAGVIDAITVAATDSNDVRPAFSNFGQCLDWFAPGVYIATTWLNHSYQIVTGTSMAAAHSAGVAALVLEGTPTATPADVRNVIYQRNTRGVVIGSRTPYPFERLLCTDY